MHTKYIYFGRFVQAYLLSIHRPNMLTDGIVKLYDDDEDDDVDDDAYRKVLNTQYKNIK